MTNITTQDRFLKHVQPVPWSGCWLWDGSDRRGYGAFEVKDENGHRTAAAHRVSYQMFRGPIPEGAQVLHDCDVKCCVNPAHLHLGDHGLNMAEAVARKRHCRGERQHLAKLTTGQVVAIRKMTGPHREIAKAFGVHQTTISDIKRGDIWQHVEGAAS